MVIKAQAVFNRNGVAHGSIQLGQIVDFIVFAQTANSHAVEINHEIVAILAQDVAGFKISLPDMGVMEFSQPQSKFLHGSAFETLIG